MSSVDRIALFLGVVVLVTGLAAGLGYATADAPGERTDATVDNDYFTSEQLLEESALEERSGDIDFERQAPRTVLIVSEGDPSEIEPVVDGLVAHGHEVRFLGGGGATVPQPIAIGTAVDASAASGPTTDLAAGLDEADALLVVGGAQFDDEEAEQIEEFADAGGRVVIATDATTSPFGGDATELTSRFGVTVGGGYLFDMHDNDANFQRVYAEGGDGTLAAGVDDLVLDGASPVHSADGTTIARTAGEETRYSETRNVDEFDVAVRSDTVVVVGDADLFRTLNYNRADNEVLVSNVLGYMTGGPSNPYTPPGAQPEEPMPPEDGPSPERPTPDDESAQEESAPQGTIQGSPDGDDE